MITQNQEILFFLKKKITEFKNNAIIVFISSLYGLCIAVYNKPVYFDIYRYIKYYSIFRQNTDKDEIIYIIFKQTPDFLFYIYSYIFAQLHIGINVLFFLITFSTVFLILYVFKNLYNYFNKFDPPKWFYIYVSLFIPAVHIFSGIRNIHAFSFVLLSYYFYLKNNRIKCLFFILYASLFHYSMYVFFIIYFVRIYVNTRRKKLFMFYFILFLLLIQIFILKNIPYYINSLEILNDSLKKKLYFYLVLHNNIRDILNSSSSFIYFIFYFFENYFILIISIFYRKIFKINILNDEYFLILNLYLLFTFFPTINNRFIILLNLLFVFKTLIQNDYNKRLLLILLLVPLMGNLLFWISVFNHEFSSFRILIENNLYK